METAEMRRFFDYVTRTSRIDAQERRRSMHRPLSGHACRNIKALVAAVDGNTRDQAWASDALKAGEIVRLPDGALALPNPRRAQPDPAVWLAELERLLEDIPHDDDFCFELFQDLALVLARHKKAREANQPPKTQVRSAKDIQWNEVEYK